MERRRGNSFRMGQAQQRGEEPGTTVGIQPGVLECVSGMFLGARIPMVNQEIVTIGRDPEICNLVLDDPDISRRHCTVQFSAAENCYFVTDYSTTGVVINGSQRLERMALNRCGRGSRLLLGRGRNEFILK